MAILEKSVLLVKLDTSNNEVWFYPVTTADNIAMGTEQMDEIITSIRNSIRSLSNLATDTSDGQMSKEDKAKLDTVDRRANHYVHPSYLSHDSGLYRVTIDTSGHVIDATEMTKEDITALGIPAQDTTYDLATTTTAGLLSPTDKIKIDAGSVLVEMGTSLPTTVISDTYFLEYTVVE